MTKLRGTALEPLTTTFRWKHLKGSRLIAEPDGKNVEDWAIRSQAPKLVMIEHWGRFND
jgi:hypothetical protein